MLKNKYIAKTKDLRKTKDTLNIFGKNAANME